MNYDLFKILRENSYPGRGIVLGRSDCGGYAVAAYFIMGRSENSRNRVFVRDGEGLRTQAHDPAKLSDPSLIIYAPVRAVGERLVVTNGDQTDTICEHLAAGGTFEGALRTRTFEPDAPNFTPRISGLVDGGDYRLSILKSAGAGTETLRQFFEYSATPAGVGHFIHTYAGDGSPLPSFAGEPVRVALAGDINAFAHALWQSLNDDNKVSLFVRYTPLSGGEAATIIINKHSD